MTVISDTVENVGGQPYPQSIVFSVETIRDTVAGDAIVSTRRYSVPLTNGAFTTADMDPGPAKVMIGNRPYDITIPDEPTPVRLWPLIDAGMPATDSGLMFVRNGGGVSRTQKLTAAAYAAIPTPDPETFYIVVP